MKSLNKGLYYLLSISLAFGSINPLKLGQVSEQVIDQQGLSPIIFLCCICISLFDKNVRKVISSGQGAFYRPLLIMISIIFFAGIVANINTSLLYFSFFVKLIIGIFGFVVVSSYFMSYPNVLKWSMLLYAVTCVLLILCYFLGYLSNYSFISNGRLWIFGINPNTFSFMMGVGLIYLLYFLITNKLSVLLKGVLLLSIFLLFFYIILSGSRGTLLFLALSIVILVLPYLKKKWYLLIPFFIAFVLASIWFINTNSNEFSIIDRFNSLGTEDDRSTLIKNALSLFSESPIFGWGRNGYVEQRLLRFRDPRDSHNVIVSILVMGGILACGCFLLYIKRMFHFIMKGYNRELSLCIFVFTFLMSMKTGDVITYMLMWYMYAVAISVSKLRLS